MPREDDPYLLPSGTLRNKLGVSSQKELDDQERDFAAARERFLLARLPGPPFTFETLRGLHRELFQDVYSWAGEPRTTPLGKREYDHPASPVRWFADAGEIATRAQEVFDRLAARDFLAGTTRTAFADGATELLVGVSNVHPFREGNGRAQRLLLSAVARNAGHELAFDVVSKERMVAVSIAAHKGDPSGVRRLLDEILDTRQVEALRAATGWFERSRFEWNERYIAATRAGQDYNGIVAARSPSDFILRADPEEGLTRILVGDTRDLPPEATAGDRVAMRASHFAPAG